MSWSLYKSHENIVKTGQQVFSTNVAFDNVYEAHSTLPELELDLYGSTILDGTDWVVVPGKTPKGFLLALGNIFNLNFRIIMRRRPKNAQENNWLPSGVARRFLTVRTTIFGTLTQK